MKKIKINTIITIAIVLGLSIIQPLAAQEYRYINGFDKEVNQRLESFLNSTLTKEGRKVAVFDCDGTLLGQSPYYLVDEAMYSYAKTHYEGRNDKLSKEKMELIKTIRGQSEGKDEYKRNILRFFAGMTPEEMQNVGWQCYLEKYDRKLYPEMKELLANMKSYGLEIWVVTASPELLYQRIVCEELGIPPTQVIGVRSRVSRGLITGDVIDPIPQTAGKADAIQTFIKARPVFACGNSRGDKEMLLESSGLRLVVNPDNKKKAKDLDGKTFKEYWATDPDAIIVYCHDEAENFNWDAPKFGVKPNDNNPLTRK